jgi:hypothetical protein
VGSSAISDVPDRAVLLRLFSKGSSGARLFSATRSSPHATARPSRQRGHVPAGDGTLPFLGLRFLAPTAVSARSMTLFGPPATAVAVGAEPSAVSRKLLLRR